MAGVNIFIVEDDPTSVHLLRKYLEGTHCQVAGVATSAVDAIQGIETIRPDLVLMDIGLSGGEDGIRIADLMQGRFDLPVIFMTGYSDTETIERARRTDPMAYLLKPFSRKELQITIDLALDRFRFRRDSGQYRRQLNAVLESSREGILLVDADGLIAQVNPAARRVLGLSSFERPLPPAGLFWLTDGETGETHTSEALLKPVAGQVRRISGTLHSPGGPPYFEAEIDIRAGGSNVDDRFGMIATFRDLTHCNAEKAVQATLSEALDSLDEGIAVITTSQPGGDGRIRFANRALSRLCGMEPEALRDRSLSALGPGGGEALAAIIQNALSTGEPLQKEVSLTWRDGTEKTAGLRIEPMGTGDRWIFVFRDLTATRQVAEAMRQSQKMEALGQLAAGVAHDFNNLLSVINTYSDLLSIRIQEEDALMKYIGNIRSAGKRATELVSRLLAFSRREDTEAAPHDPGALLKELRIMLRRVIREDIELQVEAPVGLPEIFASRGQLEQVLMNLVVNARDAMPGGGLLSLRAAPAPAHALPASLANAGAFVCISVEDTGCGMDRELQSRIFDPFFTTKEQGSGTGLGLSTVRGIVQKLGGEVTVDSEAGMGTRFDLFLPVHQRPEPTPELSRDGYSNVFSVGCEKILLIEDDESFADCISGLLSLHGYSVYNAASVAEVRERFLPQADQFRLVISDIVLPGGSGRNLVNELAEANPSLKIVLMTGYDEELRSGIKIPDGQRLLQKPFSLSEILQTVREMLDDPVPA